MRFRAALAILLAAGATAVWAANSPATPAAPPRGHYVLVTPRSQLNIYLRKSGWFAVLGDNHWIVAQRMHGSAASTGAGWTGLVVVPAAALKVADPHRSAHERADVQATMDGPTQLDIARYPRVIWRLAALAAPAPGQLMLRGRFTLHGVTRTEMWRTRWAATGGLLHMWGGAALRLSHFGIHPIRRAFGAVSVRDQFQLQWDIWWRPDGAVSGGAGQR